MAVEITVVLSDTEIDIIRDMREISTSNVQNYDKKRASDGNLTKEENREYSELTNREILLSKMEGLIDNELLRAAVCKGEYRIKFLQSPIDSTNLNADISTCEDIKRLRKLCNELSQVLRNSDDAVEKQEMNPDSEFVSLSGKELKDMVNKWIVHHVEHDEKLSPGYFARLVRGWCTAYKRRSGISILDIF